MQRKNRAEHRFARCPATLDFLEIKQLFRQKSALQGSKRSHALFHGHPIPCGNHRDNEILEFKASLGLSQKQFACLVGVFHGTIAKAECGQRQISDAMMEQIRVAVAQEMLRQTVHEKEHPTAL